MGNFLFYVSIIVADSRRKAGMNSMFASLKYLPLWSSSLSEEIKKSRLQNWDLVFQKLFYEVVFIGVVNVISKFFFAPVAGSVSG